MQQRCMVGKHAEGANQLLKKWATAECSEGLHTCVTSDSTFMWRRLQAKEDPKMYFYFVIKNWISLPS